MGDWVTRALDALDAAPCNGDPVNRLRRALAEDGTLDGAEMARLLALHRSKDPITREAGWDAFLVEAAVEHFALAHDLPAFSEDELRADWGDIVRRARVSFGLEVEPSWNERVAALGVSDESARVLVDALGCDGLVLSTVEVRLLARLFEKAARYPAVLRGFTWQALVATVAADHAIGPEEATLVAALVMGPGSEAGIAVSRAEADVIVALNRAATSKAEIWADVFARCIGAHVLYAGASPDKLDAAEQAWLDTVLAQVGATEAEALSAFLRAA